MEREESQEETRRGPEPSDRRLREVIPLGIGVHQGASTLPILGGCLRMDDQGIGLRSFEDRIGLAVIVVGRGRVRERKSIRGGEVVLILLSGGAHHTRKSMIHPHQAPTRDMRQYAVEYSSTLGVCIEAAMNEITDTSARL